jgi:hypothetical protein
MAQTIMLIVIAIAVTIIVRATKKEDKDLKSELHAKNRYSLVDDDDEYLGIFMN